MKENAQKISRRKTADILVLSTHPHLQLTAPPSLVLLISSCWKGVFPPQCRQVLAHSVWLLCFFLYYCRGFTLRYKAPWSGCFCDLSHYKKNRIELNMISIFILNITVMVNISVTQYFIGFMKIPTVKKLYLDNDSCTALSASQQHLIF